MRRTGPATITDVAALAGVSIKTVSRVLNREPRVSTDTQAKVLSAVETLSYRPNVMARGLASRRSALIGLVCENPSLHYIHSVQLGAMRKAAELGMHVAVVHGGGRGLRPEDVLRFVHETHLAGLILAPPIGDDPRLIEMLLGEGVRVVGIAPRAPHPAIPSVYIDDVSAAREITELLLRLGHARIGLIEGPADHGASHWRKQGFAQAMAAAGRRIDPEFLRQGDFSFRAAMDAGAALLEREVRPTAVFACNDDMAAGVLAAALRLGISVPDQLSIAGFDDSSIATIVWPQLTTIRQPVDAMAEQAVRLLVEADGPARLRLPYAMIERGSTATVSTQK